MAEVIIHWDHTAIHAAIASPAGPFAAVMARIAEDAVQEMKRRCPVSPVGALHVSGELRSSIRAFRQGDGSYLIGPTKTVSGGHLLGDYIERGTRPHIIESHGPWPLRNRETGQVFGRIVHHPGTRPQPFIEPTAREIGRRTYHG